MSKSPGPSRDEVLKRMLKTPPKPHALLKAKKKPNPRKRASAKSR